MNEKISKFVDVADKVIDAINALPRFVDCDVERTKKSAMNRIPKLVNRFASKLSVTTFLLSTLYFFSYCMRVVICERDARSEVWLYVFGSIFIAILGSYIIYKMMGAFDSIISSTQCRISSLTIFSIMVVVFKSLSLCSVIAGINFAICFANPLFVIGGIVAALFFFLLALYNSAPEDFAVVQDENASTGEDLIAIITFAVKLNLRLIPLATFILPIIVMIMCPTRIYINYIFVLQKQSICILVVGALPLIAYFYYLINYVVLDVIRAVLSLPRKLDELKK